jgi:hypothetical protein
MFRHPREFRIVTSIMGDFVGFRPGSLFVLEHEPDRVWRQVGVDVLTGIFRFDPPCIVCFDPTRCVSVTQMVLSVEDLGETLIERIVSRPVDW